jgi:uncharacterized protein with ATP-grasp and redox domains
MLKPNARVVFTVLICLGLILAIFTTVQAKLGVAQSNNASSSIFAKASSKGDPTADTKAKSDLDAKVVTKIITKGDPTADTKAKSNSDAKVVTKGAIIDDSLSKSSPDASLKVDTKTTLDIGLDVGE